MADEDDAFPLDPFDSVDSDGDGVGDNSDVMPLNPAAFYRFVGEQIVEGVGSVLSAGDVDGDARSEILIGAPYHDAGDRSDSGAVYVIDGAGLSGMDAADGSVDQVIIMDDVGSDGRSWRLVGESESDRAGWDVASAGDLDGDGLAELLVGAPYHEAGRSFDSGAVYVVAAADLHTLDAADGSADQMIELGNVATGRNSWKLVGEARDDRAGWKVVPAGDFDGDGLSELLVGVPYHDARGRSDSGAVYVVAAVDLPSLDAADGSADQIIELGNVPSGSNSWKLVGELSNDQAGQSVASVGDLDGDGLSELLVGAPYHDAGSRSDSGAVYLISGGSFATADGEDGNADGVVDLGRIAALPWNWKLRGEGPYDRAGWSVVTAGDLDGDGLSELLVGAPYHDAGGRSDSGAAYVLSGGGLAGMDQVDGEADGVVDLGHAASQSNSWKLTGESPYDRAGVSIAAEGDVDGDGLADLLVGAPFHDAGGHTDSGAAYVLSGGSLVGADEIDGEADGVVDLGRAASQSNSWKLSGESRDGQAGWSVAYAGDLDGDGLVELLVGAPYHDAAGRSNSSVAYLVSGDGMAVLDEADGAADRTLGLHNVAADTDGDGVRNIVDLDDDGDGVIDWKDSSPLKSDHDRKGQDDDDGDGVPDVNDRFPRDPSEWGDADGDDIGDNADPDDDNDGVPDEDDDLPLNALETVDSDGDGVGNNADAFPENSAETADTDGDGVGDNADAFPESAAETADTDGDGVGDNSDSDDDGDGVADGDDVFPLDPLDWVDSDGDGVGDNWDLLPRDPSAADITASYRFIGEQRYDGVGDVLSAGDIDGDGLSDILIGAPAHDAPELTNIGAVYLIAAADLPGLDAADGSADQAVHLGHVASGPNSWKLLGEHGLSYAGRSLASADLDNDGRSDLVVGAVGGHADRGAVFVVASADLAAADAADGAVDGVAGLDSFAALPDSWKLVGGHLYGKAGKSVAIVDDLDGDGRPELAIGAPGHDAEDGSSKTNPAGAAYIVASGEMAAIDSADGDSDGVIHFPANSRTITHQEPNAVSGVHSWTIIGEASDDRAGSSIASVDDLDGDGFAELLVGAPRADYARVGAVYLLSSGDLAEADAADGAADTVIDLGLAAALPGNWKFVGPGWTHFGIHVSSAGDLNGDNHDELIVETQAANGTYGTWIVSGTGLDSLDNASGTETADGVIDLLNAPSPPNSWKTRNLKVTAAGDVDGNGSGDLALVGTSSDLPHGHTTFYLLDGADLDGLPDIIASSDLDDGARTWKFRSLSGGGDALVSPAGDVDGDGLADLLFGESRPGVVHVLLSADLAVLDDADGVADQTVGLHNLAGDADGDGVRNIVDRDDDGDGVEDTCDLAPLDPRATNVDVSNDLCLLDSAESKVTRLNLESDRGKEIPKIPARSVLKSYKFYPEPMEPGLATIDASAVGDVHGDGLDDIVVGVSNETRGAMYVISGRDLPGADGADGESDGSIDLARVAAQPDSWRVTGTDGSLASLYGVGPAGDMDGDGLDDIAISTASMGGAIYLVSGANLSLSDELDGRADGQISMNRLLSLPGSHELVCKGGNGARCSVAPMGDFVGDGSSGVIVGVPGRESDGVSGSVDVILAKDLNSFAGPETDLHAVSNARGSWTLTGEAPAYVVGRSVSGIGDIGVNWSPHMVIGAPNDFSRPISKGEVYVIAANILTLADSSRNDINGRIELPIKFELPGAWNLVGEAIGDEAGASVSYGGDIDRDGRADVLIGAPGAEVAGAAYLVSGADLASADAVDGALDGVIELGRVALQPGSWKITGEADGWRAGHVVSLVDDVSGDGVADLVIGAFALGTDAASAYVLSGAELRLADSADGVIDGIVDLDHAVSIDASWKIVGETNEWGWSGLAPRDASDVDGDGRADLVLTHAASWVGTTAIYLLSGSDLPTLDEADGTSDRVIHLTSVQRRFSPVLMSTDN